MEKSETEPTRRFQSPPGATVTVYGQTDVNTNCGFSSVNSLLSMPRQFPYTAGFTKIHKSLLEMGYQEGLTLYAAPYDWRKTTVANGVGTALNQTLKQANSLTGKPSVIIAHSMGNFGALYTLNSLSAADKRKLVHNYVSLMNPLAGAPKALVSFLGGNNEYYYNLGLVKLGINHEAMNKFLYGSSGNFDLLPKDPFTQFKGEKWLQAWEERNKIETDYVQKEDKEGLRKLGEQKKIPFSWFPTQANHCFEMFDSREDECKLPIYDWSNKDYVAKVEGREFTGKLNDMKELLTKYTEIGVEPLKHLIEDTRANNVYLLKNPEVPVTIVYASHVRTRKAFDWDYDPVKFSKETGKYAIPSKVHYTHGDDSVPSASSLLPALKWAWEFDHKNEANGIKDAQPIKTVEFCSLYNQKGNIYDDGNKVTKNEYIGMQCECTPEEDMTSTNGKACDHSGVLVDARAIEFMQNIVSSGFKSADIKTAGALKMNDAQLQALSQKCPIVNVGLEHYKGKFNIFTPILNFPK